MRPKDIVVAFLDRVGSGDFEAARALVHDGLTFQGVLGSRNGASVYFQDMERLRLSYKVHRAFEDGSDVCVLYDIRFSPTGITEYGAGHYRLREGRIESIRVVFDPRSLIEAPQQSGGEGLRQPHATFGE